MIAVADASVLIALGGLKRLAWLHELFAEGVLTPSSVWREVVVRGKGRPGAEAVGMASWLQVLEVSDPDYVRLLLGTLDIGEAEALALARERHADVVLFDEKAARATAVQMGFRVLGTVGVLIWAKKTRRLESLKEELERLRKTAGFYLAESVVVSALRTVGEYS